jgi:two-component system sensor histidine kinase CpxA
MRSLLARIFVSYFGATALVVILMVSATVWAVASEQKKLELPRMAELASDAQDVSAATGLVGLKGWAALVNVRLRPVQLEVLDAQGNRVTRTATAGTAEQPRARRSDTSSDFVRNFIGPDGRPWRIVVRVPYQRLFGLLGEPRVAWTLWPMAALVFGVVCFLVARSLSVPIQLLRDAANRIAHGDLDSAVAPQLERRRDEIGELARDFRVMAGSIRELLQSKQQLIRDMSHELRTPLTRIRMGIELAGQGSATPTATSAQLARDVERLDELIGQMLRLASVNDPALTLSARRVNLGHLLRQVAQDCAIECAPREIAIKVSGPEDLFTPGDPDLLRSAFENVLRNSIRYSPERGVITVEAHDDAGRCVIRIRDQGVGVPEEFLSRIFEPLFRVAPARDTGSGGNGIGLAIVARVVRVHGGSVSAANARPSGLVTTIELPGGAPGAAAQAT